MNRLEQWAIKHRIIGDIDNYIINYDKSVLKGWRNLEKADFTDIPPVRIIDCNTFFPAEQKMVQDINDIIIPDTVEIIGESTFSNFRSIRKVVIPESVKEIRGLAFCGCVNLSEVILPSTNIYISPHAFKMTSFIMNEFATKGYFSHNGKMIRGNGEWDDDNKLGLIVPDDIKSLNEEVMSNTKIEYFDTNDFIDEIPSSAFVNCLRLSSVNIGKSVKIIGDLSFCNCESLTQIKIPGNVIKIFSHAFWQDVNLEEVIFDNGIKEIDRQAFSKCTSLKKVVIPRSCEKIYDSAFADCKNALVYVPKTTRIECITGCEVDELEDVTTIRY